MRTAILLGFLASLVLVAAANRDLVALLTKSTEGDKVALEVTQLSPDKLRVCMTIKNEDCDAVPTTPTVPPPPPVPENSCATNPIRDCSCFKDMVNASFSFKRTIKPDLNGPAFQVYCDADGKGTIWTAIMYREGDDFSTKANWTRSFSYYENGFSGLRTDSTMNLDEDHFIGLKRISALTKAVPCKLKLEVSNADYDAIHQVRFDTFLVGGADTQYTLTIGDRNSQSAEGVITSFVADSNGQPFSTPDRDNSANCANRHRGGWWFKPTTATSCSAFNPVGPGLNAPAAPAGRFSYDEKGLAVPAGSVYLFVAPK